MLLVMLSDCLHLVLKTIAHVKPDNITLKMSMYVFVVLLVCKIVNYFYPSKTVLIYLCI